RVGTRASRQMRTDGDVLVHGEAGERLHDLEGAHDASPRHEMGRHARDVLAAVKDAAFARRQEPADDGEQRGLARAVVPDQRADPPGFYGERNIVDGEEAAEAFEYALDAKQRLSHGRAPGASPSNAQNAHANRPAGPRSRAGQRPQSGPARRRR